MKQNKVFTVAKRIFTRRKYKDILFRFIFREPEELLQLYNAMNHTQYTNSEDLIITTMEDVVYIGMKNDLSFLIANEMNLYEHQSTINQNMPLRGLLYLAKMYESYIETNKMNRYQKKRIQLPFPRFIVFYNGEEDLAEELYMKLSDAFEKKEEEPAIECIAKFVNINYGYNKELMANCKRLHDYSYFVSCVRRYFKQGNSQRKAVELAVDECIEKGVLDDILLKHRAEVMDMFLTKFDKKMYEDAIREEGMERGLEQGLEQGREETLENMAKRLKNKGFTIEEVRDIMPEYDEDKLKKIYN